MDPLTIDIYDEQVVGYVRNQASITGQSTLQVVQEAIRQLMRNQPVQEVNDISSLVSELQKEYYAQYKKRFELEPPNENGLGASAVNDIVVPMVNTTKDVKKVETILKRAIVWYLNFHNNSDDTGANFPYGMKYLFSKTNVWLLRTCIESSAKLDDDLFQTMQKHGGITRDAAIRMLRRGDAAGLGKQETPMGDLHRAQILYAEIKESLPNLESKHAFKNHAKLNLLFKNDMPPAAYIVEAIDFLEKFKLLIAGRDYLKAEPT